MWSGWVVWAWAWVWVCLPCLTHTHSTQEDPLLNPRKAGLLTSLQSQVNTSKSGKTSKSGNTSESGKVRSGHEAVEGDTVSLLYSKHASGYH